MARSEFEHFAKREMDVPSRSIAGRFEPCIYQRVGAMFTVSLRETYGVVAPVLSAVLSAVRGAYVVPKLRFVHEQRTTGSRRLNTDEVMATALSPCRRKAPIQTTQSTYNIHRFTDFVNAYSPFSG